MKRIVTNRLRCFVFERQCKKCKRNTQEFCEEVNCDCPCQYGDDNGRCACICPATETEIKRKGCTYYEELYN